MWHKRASLPPSATATGFLSSMHRKLAVTCNAQGLHIRPTTEDDEGDAPYSGAAVKIPYGRKQSPLHINDYEETSAELLIVDGIGGLINGPGLSARRPLASLAAQCHNG